MERYETGRKYKKEWERQYVWVTESTDGQGTAYCKICKKSMQPKVWSLSKHESCTEHAKRVKEKSTNKTLFVEKTPSAKKKSNLLKQAEIQFAVGIVCHASVAAVDHLGKLLANTELEALLVICIFTEQSVANLLQKWYHQH